MGRKDEEGQVEIKSRRVERREERIDVRDENCVGK